VFGVHGAVAQVAGVRAQTAAVAEAQCVVGCVVVGSRNRAQRYAVAARKAHVLNTREGK